MTFELVTLLCVLCILFYQIRTRQKYLQEKAMLLRLNNCLDRIALENRSKPKAQLPSERPKSPTLWEHLLEDDDLDGVP